QFFDRFLDLFFLFSTRHKSQQSSSETPRCKYIQMLSPTRKFSMSIAVPAHQRGSSPFHFPSPSHTNNRPESSCSTLVSPLTSSTTTHPFSFEDDTPSWLQLHRPTPVILPVFVPQRSATPTLGFDDTDDENEVTKYSEAVPSPEAVFKLVRDRRKPRSTRFITRKVEDAIRDSLLGPGTLTICDLCVDQASWQLPSDLIPPDTPDSDLDFTDSTSSSSSSESQQQHFDIVLCLDCMIQMCPPHHRSHRHSPNSKSHSIVTELPLWLLMRTSSVEGSGRKIVESVRKSRVARHEKQNGCLEEAFARVGRTLENTRRECAKKLGGGFSDERGCHRMVREKLVEVDSILRGISATVSMER
ncbi:hypothetical protein BJ742DRAFT_909906, partial [Cladochytrium replicatum]